MASIDYFAEGSTGDPRVKARVGRYTSDRASMCREGQSDEGVNGRQGSSLMRSSLGLPEAATKGACFCRLPSLSAAHLGQAKYR